MLFLYFAKVNLSNRLQMKIEPATRRTANFLLRRVFWHLLRLNHLYFIVIYCMEKYRAEQRADIIIMVKNNSCLILLWHFRSIYLVSYYFICNVSVIKLLTFFADGCLVHILSIYTWFKKNQLWNFFQKSSWTSLIFSLFQTWFLLPM